MEAIGTTMSYRTMTFEQHKKWNKAIKRGRKIKKILCKI